MLKEGESLVHFKLRFQNELKDLELNHPELVEEYKKELFGFIVYNDEDFFASPEQRRAMIESVEPDYYQSNQTREQMEADADADMKAAMPFLVLAMLIVFGLGAGVVMLMFNFVGSLIGV
jgi:hypothetical protein